MTENERMSISGLLDVLNTGISFSTCHIEYAIQGNVLEDLISCLEELEQYRAIGTVEGYKRAIKVSKENYYLCAEYKAKLKEYEAIGTIEEFKALKEKLQDVEITIIDRMQEFYNEYRSISQSSVDHFGGKADAIETSQQIIKGVFKDVLGIDWQ